MQPGIVTGTGGAGGDIFENKPSRLVADRASAAKMFKLSTKITGAQWPVAATGVRAVNV